MSDPRACEFVFATPDGSLHAAIATFPEGVAYQRALYAIAGGEYESDEHAWRDFLAFHCATEITTQ